MNDNFTKMILSGSNDMAVKKLKSVNEITAKYGLVLSDNQLSELVIGRQEALVNADRIEFGEGILKKLILAFCDSQYLSDDNYFETVYELQEAFYYFKNESYDTISDDEIIEAMRYYFDNYAHGSVEYIVGTSLEEICRYARYSSTGLNYEDDDLMQEYDEEEY